MRVIIDEDRCIACGACWDLCSSVFRLGDAGGAEVVTDPTSACWSCVREAAEDCPEGAITVLEDEIGPG